MKQNGKVMPEFPARIGLTEDEEALLAWLSFDVRSLPSPEAVHENGRVAHELTVSLQDRGAIPEHRLRYFADPSYNVGGHGKSRKDVIEGNHRLSGSIANNPHFLKHLHYFLFGPDLHHDFMTAFVSNVKERGDITSGDLEPLAKQVRALARRHGLDRSHKDQLFQLALETGLDVSQARYLRNALKSVR